MQASRANTAPEVRRTRAVSGLLCCLAVLAVALACGLPLAPPIQPETGRNPLSTLHALCTPTPHFTPDDRAILLQHVRLIDSVLREALQPDIRTAITSSSLRWAAGIASRSAPPGATPALDTALCQTLWYAGASVTNGGEDRLTYRFPDTTIRLRDPELAGAFGSTFAGELIIRVERESEAGPGRRSQQLSTVWIELSPADVHHRLQVDRLSVIAGRLFKLPQGANAKEMMSNGVYQQGIAGFETVTRRSGTVIEAQARTTWYADEKGAVSLVIVRPVAAS